MGEIIGNVFGVAVDKFSKMREVSRESIAAKLREIADGVERGDIVPEEALERARARKKLRDDIRDGLPD